MPLDTIKHYPVMANEVLSYITNNKTIIDCTFGGGGYSSKILKKYKGSKGLIFKDAECRARRSAFRVS